MIVHWLQNSRIQRWRFLTVFILVLTVSTGGRSDVVWLTSGEVLYGVVLLETDESITIADHLESAIRQTTEIPRSEVNTFLRTIDLKKLEMLDPQSPNSYRELVEDLARFPHDPHARELARRLSLIGLTLADHNLRRDFHLSLQESFDQADRKRLDEIVEASLERVQGEKGALPFTATQTDVDQLLKLVQAIRRESWETAGQLLENSRVRQTHENWLQIITWLEIETAFEMRQISRIVLLKLLKLEFELASARTPLAVARPANLDWQACGAAEFRGNAELPTIKREFGIDPQQSVFRSGAWVKP